MEELAGTLGKAVMFRGLNEQQLQSVIRVAVTKQVAQGAPIFKEGDRGEELYLIVKGKVRISRQYPLGGDETLAVLEGGQAFGEMAIFGAGSVRSATAQAAAKCELLIIKRESFRQLLDKDRDLAYIVLWNVLQQVLERLRATNDKVMMFLAAPVLT